MLDEKDGELVQVRASGLSDLLVVVIQQFQHYCFEAILLKSEYKANITPEILSEKCPENKSRCLIAQTFTAMVIEAFYFDYKHGKESKRKAEEWSKQSPLTQFEQLSSQYLGLQNVNELDLYHKLSNLNKLRKRWVHNQSTPIGHNKRDLNYLSPIGCLDLLIDFFEYFSEYDKECHTARFTFSILTSIKNQANEPVF